MKKIFYLFIVFSIVFTACNPIDDIHEDIDQVIDSLPTVDANIEYTLKKDDYPEETVYYNSVDIAREIHIPELLVKEFPYIGSIIEINGEDTTFVKQSKVKVTYEYNDSYAYEVYGLSDDDYTEAGLSSNRLVTNSDFYTFLNYKFPDEENDVVLVENGDIVEITYKTDPTNYDLTDDDYDFVGDGRFDNFDIRSGEEEIRKKIQTILFNNFPDNPAGTIYKINYDTYDGSGTGSDSMIVELEIPEPTEAPIKYTLTDDDFDLVGNGQYDNFDIREGAAEESEEVRREKIETILLTNFPDTVEGTFYEVTYEIYDGSRYTLTMLVFFDGTGYPRPFVYNIIDPDYYIEQTTSFIYMDNWNFPYVLTTEDYTAMGRSSNDLDGASDAQVTESLRLLGRYLGNKFTNAATGDHMIATYNSEDMVENAHFLFDGADWQFIPELVLIKTQDNFIHDGFKWVYSGAIEYRLVSEDYELIANDAELQADEDYEDALSSLGNFSNFDRRSTADAYWSDEMVLAAINIVLADLSEDAEIGQEYAVTIDIYDGSRGEELFYVVKTDAGLAFPEE